MIDASCFGYSVYSEVCGRGGWHSGVNVCGGGTGERSPTNNKGGGRPNAQTFLTPMNMQHTNI